MAPVVTVVPVPVVVVEATEVTPWVMLIVNWSLAKRRPAPPRAFWMRRCGKAVFVKVQAMASPNCKAPKLKFVVATLFGNGVVDPAVPLVQVRLGL